MSRPPLKYLLVFALTGTAAAAGPTTAPNPQPAARPQTVDIVPPRRAWDHYVVVVDRNIFLRGGAGNIQPGNGDIRNATGTPTAAWMLTGIALQAKDRVAFLENTLTGATLRVHAGQTIEAGRVLRVEEYGMDFITDGKTLKVTVGAQLNGEAGPTTMPAAADSSSGNPATSAAEAVILERLRARRNQELGK